MDKENEKTYSYFYFPSLGENFQKNFEHYLINDFPVNYLDLNPRINIFVGANNSGKSRFLRLLEKFLQGKIKLVADYNFSYIFSLLSIYETTNPQIGKQSDEGFSYLIQEAIRPIYHPLIGYLRSESNQFNSANLLSQYFTEDLINCLCDSINNDSKYEKKFVNKTGQIRSFLRDTLKTLNQNFQLKTSFQKIERITYIPILRTALNLFHPNDSMATKNLLVTSVQKNYGINSLFTGESLLQDILNSRNSSPEARKDFVEFQEFIRKKFFPKEESLEIISSIQNSTQDEKGNLIVHNPEIKVKIGNKEERKLCELGDGIQALMILLYPIFTAKENSWILIEEPELNLHPGFQRIFLDTILNDVHVKKKNLKIFFTTHSNHLLDLEFTAKNEDVAIYSFEPASEEGKFNIRLSKPESLKLLDALGVSNTSIFLAKYSIWVEGISDRFYIKAFLKAYIEQHELIEMIEDIDFAFFEYAGSNYTHYSFQDGNELSEQEKKEANEQIKAFALANRIFMIADKDGEEKDKKHELLKSFEEKLKEQYPDDESKFKYKALKRREIECLLTPENIEKALSEKYPKFQSQNFKKISYQKYKNSVFIKYICKKFPEVYSESYLDKAEIAKSFYNLVQDGKIKYNDLSKEAQKLSEEVYNFISNASNKAAVQNTSLSNSA